MRVCVCACVRECMCVRMCVEGMDVCFFLLTKVIAHEIRQIRVPIEAKQHPHAACTRNCGVVLSRRWPHDTSCCCCCEIFIYKIIALNTPIQKETDIHIPHSRTYTHAHAHTHAITHNRVHAHKFAHADKQADVAQQLRPYHRLQHSLTTRSYFSTEENLHRCV